MADHGLCSVSQWGSGRICERGLCWVAPLVVNLYLLPVPVVGIGRVFFGFLLPVLAFSGMSKYWRQRQFWLFWLLYLAILVWDTWFGIRVGKAIGGWTGA